MNALKAKKTPECILRSLPEIIEVRIPDKKYREYNDQNIIIHSVKVTESKSKVRKVLIRGLAEFIVAPIIVDSFPSNVERNEWTKKLKEINRHVYNFFELNKLRATNISKPLSILKNNLLEVDRPSWRNDIARIQSKIIQNGGKYTKLKTGKKVEIAEELTEISYHAYDEIIHKLGL